jgi:hypothetical protein
MAQEWTTVGTRRDVSAIMLQQPVELISWPPALQIESDPGVFSEMLWALGCQGVQVSPWRWRLDMLAVE